MNTIRTQTTAYEQHNEAYWRKNWLVNVEHQAKHSQLTTVVAMLALVVAAGLAFWYGLPVVSVAHKIHQIAQGGF